MTGHDAFDADIEPDDTGIAALLGSLPDPGPMPPDITARISTALAQESGISGPPGLANITSIETFTRRRPRRLLWWSAGVAAAVVAFGGGGGPELLGRLSGDLTAHSTSAAESLAPAPLTAAFSAVDTNKDYSAASLGAQAGQLLTAAPAASAVSPQPTSTSDPERVLVCLRGLSIESDRVSIDLAAYQGRPATIVAVQRGTERTAYVLSPACTGVPGDLIAGPVPIP